ncbi:efflux RND transporter periplasmic adaptor subunit [Desulfobacter sp.]|uniref:efflux RND transporter periplasmic adaptor subunit n=1 Tax=Desulfobacter sp. TaxID=2294 RepID=UPI003D0AF4B2
MNQIPSKTSFGVTLVKIILPVCLTALGVAGFWYYKSNTVKFKRKPAAKIAPVVDIIKMNPGRATALIRAMGTVRPDREVVIKSQVAGTVIQVAPEFVRGGLIPKGRTMVRIDPADYTLAVNKAQSALARAWADFEIEKGQQQVAREELKLMAAMSPNGVRETSLVLRKPQLEQVRAAVASAQSDLDAARLDLERTRIIAPSMPWYCPKRWMPVPWPQTRAPLPPWWTWPAFRWKSRCPWTAWTGSRSMKPRAVRPVSAPSMRAGNGSDVWCGPPGR